MKQTRLFLNAMHVTLHYITLETIYSGLSKSNFKNHCGDAAK